MNFYRGLLVAGLAATLLACSSSDTILALNVTSSEDVGPVSKLQVTIMPQGESALATEFEPPSRELDGGGDAIALRFFKRIKLPDHWERVLTDVQVDAVDENGMTFLSAATQVTIRPEGAVAAFVMFARPAPPAEGGAGGAGGAGGDNGGGAPVDAGAGGTAAGTGGGMPSEAGAGGAGGAGGASDASGAGGVSGDGGSAGSTDGGAGAGG